MTHDIGIKVKAPKTDAAENDRKNPFNGTFLILLCI